MRPMTIGAAIVVLATLAGVARADASKGDGFSVTLWQPATPAALVILYGAFCALWAQNTGRSGWLWFFMGVVFSVITLGVLLHKNAADRKIRPLGQ